MKKVLSFTLVELLTVIAIMMILASLLFPAASGAHRRADQVMCGSNLKQLTAGMTMYAQDHEWRLPPYVRNAIYEHGGVNWARYIRAYYDDVKVLDCPASVQPAPPDTREGLHLYDGNYGWNYDGTQGNRGRLYHHVACPSRGYLLFDSGDQCVIYGENTWENLMEELDLDWDSFSEGPNRHDGKVVIGMVDGHVESRTLMPFLAMPCRTNQEPWYMEWFGGQVELGTVPFPHRH